MKYFLQLSSSRKKPAIKSISFLLFLVIYLGFSLRAQGAESQQTDARVESSRTAQMSRMLVVLSVDAGASQSIADRLMIRLQEDPTLAFVEREQIAQITNEQVLTLSGAEAASRIKAGTLVGAEILVLVGREKAISGVEMIRVLVCDSATGARIGQGKIPMSHPDLAPLVATVRETLARFPNRVETVVTVSDFISRDLEFDYSHLQKDLAELLREALSVHQGIAVVEIEEARSIADEMALHDGDVRRLVPLNVVGEFRTDRLAEGGPQISIGVRLIRGGNDLVLVKSGAIPVDRAGRFVVETLQDKVTTTLGQTDGDGIGLDEQFNQLVQRADQFAEIGDFERAAASREAAVLLRPDASDQRIRLVREYVRWNRNPVEVWPEGAAYSLTDPFWKDIVARSRATWRRSLFHTEYLIRNRLVTMKVGAELFDHTIHSISGIRGISFKALAVEEELKKDFIRNTAPALFRLEGHMYINTTKQYRESAASCIFRNAFFRVDGNFLAGEDLLLVGDLLCDLLPEDIPYPMGIVSRLMDRTDMSQDEEANVFNEQWVQFATRLGKSERPLVKAYGDYALICHRYYRQKELSEDLLSDARKLVAYLNTGAVNKRDTDGNLRREATTDMKRIQRRLERLKQDAPRQTPALKTTPPAAPNGPEAGPKELPDGVFLCERVRLKPVDITLALKDGKQVPLSGYRWPAAGGWAGWRGFLPAWKGTDIIYSAGAVLFLNEDGTAREVLTGENLSIHSVVFDGKYVWAASGYDVGIYVIDETGEIIAHVRHEQGLPSAYVAMQIKVMEQGEILAAGSIGQSGRGWLATVALEEDHKPGVTVFHEAVKAWNYQDKTPEMMLDPHMRFDPDWIIEYRDPAGDRWFFVDRYTSPLVIHAETLDVTVCAFNGSFTSFPRNEPPAEAFLSHGGCLYVAGSRGDFKVFEMNPETKVFKETEKRSHGDWHYGNARGGRLVLEDEYLLYVGGQRWLRHQLETGKEEILLSDPRSLPDYGSGGYWSLGKSWIFGLIAWYKGKIYQVSFDPL
ncbi:MAG: CsgG/HfaB family protein [Kiritimatiellia bacterium]